MMDKHKMDTGTVRTRFAPSPTGYLHVGGARTALFNWLFARHHGGIFILRIEDTDEERNTFEAYEAILNGLRWLKLDWDEGPGSEGERGPYYQSLRNSVYEKHLQILKNSDQVYKDDGAIRFRVPKTDITFNDRICGEQSINLTETGSRAWDKDQGEDISTNPDFIIRRPDGSFLFHFVNVVDDIEMGITHVLRGEDHLSNTPKHVALFNALNAPLPVFAHIPLILNSDGSKMSKRDAGAGIEWYRDNGFLPEAVRNYISLLGWSPKDDREKLPIEEIIELFDFSHLNNSNARFDLEKCRWLNGQYIADLPELDFIDMARHFSGAAPAEAISLTQPRVQCLSEIPGILSPILDNDHILETAAAAKVSKNPETEEILRKLNSQLESIDSWDAETIQATVTEYANNEDLKVGSILFPLRVCATGVGQGTDLMLTLETIGRDPTTARIKERLDKIYHPDSSHD